MAPATNVTSSQKARKADRGYSISSSRGTLRDLSSRLRALAPAGY